MPENPLQLLVLHEKLRCLAGSNPSACPQESALGRYGLRALSFNGWDGGIRTPNSRHQKPEFYR